MSNVINPLNDKPLDDNASSLVKDLRGVRKGARNAKRSGHPGKRAEAARVEQSVPQMILRVYENAL